MPVYANCDYCGEKNLLGHLKFYRFCEKKFCANCHLKHKLPHLFHEIEDFMNRPVNLEEVEFTEEAQEHPEYIPINMTVPHTLPPDITNEIQTIIPEPSDEYSHKLVPKPDLLDMVMAKEGIEPVSDEEVNAASKEYKKELRSLLEEEEKYNRLVVTAFSYSKEKPLFMKIIPENGLNEFHKAAWSAEHYLRNFSPEVDFVVIAKIKKD